jgi:hypothetical protein
VNEMNDDTKTHINCGDRERIFEDGSATEWAALESHAAACPACAEEIRAWESLSVAAVELRDYSDSPALWPRIQKSLAQQAADARQQKSGRAWSWDWDSLRENFAFHWQTALASAMVLLLVASAGWFHWHSPGSSDGAATGAKGTPKPGELLRTNALADVERTEAAYMQAIDKLAAEAKPQLDKSETPLLANYREKLQVLDSAIDDLRAQAGQNPSNAHLRYQLLAMYQEKQRTLEEVLEVKR